MNSFDGHASAPREKPPLDQKSDYQLSTFYSIAFGDNGTVIAVDTGKKEVYSEEERISIAREILTENNISGRFGALTYIVDHRPNYTLVALMDNTVSESGLSTLLHNVLIVGSAAILVMFFISLVLSARIIRPLEENDQKQKQFISDASHELKTPVAVISTNAELLSREFGENEWLSNIVYENDRMGGLVRQLLDLSRAENAEIPMEHVDFSRVVTGETLAFDRFYRVDEARNSEGQHYGLGLSIAKAVVEKHGGSINVSCRDGKVRFTASIPIKK